jgi:hypothetical protein
MWTPVFFYEWVKTIIHTLTKIEIPVIQFIGSSINNCKNINKMVPLFLDLQVFESKI